MADDFVKSTAQLRRENEDRMITEYLDTISTASFPLSEAILDAMLVEDAGEALSSTLAQHIQPVLQENLLSKAGLDINNPEDLALLAQHLQVSTGNGLRSTPDSLTADNVLGFISNAMIMGETLVVPKFGEDRQPDVSQHMTLSGGMHGEKFYVNAFDPVELQFAADQPLPCKAPGLWDRICDTFKSLFNSRDQVCLEWEQHLQKLSFMQNTLTADNQAIRGATDTYLEMMVPGGSLFESSHDDMLKETMRDLTVRRMERDFGPFSERERDELAQQTYRNKEEMELAAYGLRLGASFSHYVGSAPEFPSPMAPKEAMALDVLSFLCSATASDLLKPPVPEVGSTAYSMLSSPNSRPTAGNNLLGAVFTAVVVGSASYLGIGMDDAIAYLGNPLECSPEGREILDGVMAMWSERMREEPPDMGRPISDYYQNGLKVMQDELFKMQDLNSARAHHFSWALTGCGDMERRRELAEQGVQAGKSGSAEALRLCKMLPSTGYTPPPEVVQLSRIHGDIHAGTYEHVYNGGKVLHVQREVGKTEPLTSIVCGQMGKEYLSTLGTTPEERQSALSDPKNQQVYQSMQNGMRQHISNNIETYAANGDAISSAINGGAKNGYYQERVPQPVKQDGNVMQQGQQQLAMHGNIPPLPEGAVIPKPVIPPPPPLPGVPGLG